MTAKDDSERGGSGAAIWWLVAVPAAYFAFFAPIPSEYLLFGSETVISSCPEWAQGALEVIYLPLLWLVRTLGVV